MAPSSHTRRGRRSRSFSSVNSPAAAGVMSRPRNRTMPISRDTRGRTSGRDTSSRSCACGRARSGTIVKPTPLRTKLYSVANWLTVTAWRNVNPAVAAAPSMIRRGVGAFPPFHTNSVGGGERVPHGQNDIKGLCAKALRCEWLRHVRDISESKIRQAAVNIILDVALNAFSQMDLNSGELPLVSCDDLRQRDMGQRHDA